MNEFETNNQNNQGEQATPEVSAEESTSPVASTTPETSMPEPEKKSIGQVIGIVVIIAVIIIGGLYFYGKSIYKSSPVVDDNVTAEEILAQPDEELTSLEQQSASDSVGSIEEDLANSDFDIDAELEQIDAELGQ
ncbi:hypothetical protein ACFL0K_01915 [Patescibacteria group bacterium]